MTSRKILIIHTTLFALFCIGSISSPFVYWWYPNFFSGYLVFGFLLLALTVLVSWYVFEGCPFTVWEKRYRKHENQETIYDGACIDHYARQWFGIKLPKHASTIVLLFLLALPIIVGLAY